MNGKKIKQINNLVIYQDTTEKINYFGNLKTNPNFGKYSVWSPDGRCLESGLILENAEEFCRNTLDYLSINTLQTMARDAYLNKHEESLKQLYKLNTELKRRNANTIAESVIKNHKNIVSLIEQIENATYISYWDNGAKLHFPCKVDLSTKEVFDIKLVPEIIDDFDIFQGEAVMLENGKIYNLYSKSLVNAGKNIFWHCEDSFTKISVKEYEEWKAILNKAAYENAKKPSLEEQVKKASDTINKKNVDKVSQAKDSIDRI